jgi:DUF4097 and DUF4098 domain-containing protein YvlB
MNRISVAAFFLPCLLLTGCEFEPGDWSGSDKYKEAFSYDYQLKSGGRLSLETINGSVEIIGWERDAVAVTGNKYASKEDVMKAIKIDAASQSDSLSIRVVRPVENNCNCGASFQLKVPRKILLDLVRSSNGSVRVESVDGKARLVSSNGSVKIWAVNGDVDITTSNASIEVGQFQGAAMLRTSNGRIKADGVKGTFEAVTSNASIDATIQEPANGVPIAAKSSNGSVTLALLSWKNNPVRVTTSNASVNLRLPDGVNAQLTADTSNGSISSDFEMTTNKFGKTHVEAKLGSGGPAIDLNTSNGSIRLLRR